jgi:hypothetical protein
MSENPNHTPAPVPASQATHVDDPPNPLRNTGWFDTLQSRSKPPRTNDPGSRQAWYLPLEKERYGQKATTPSNLDTDVTMRSPRQVRGNSISGPSSQARKVRNDEDENPTDGDVEDNCGDADQEEEQVGSSVKRTPLGN